MMFDIFLKNIPKEMEILERAMDQHDADAAKALLHKIRPNFMMVGLPELNKTTTALEDGLKDASLNLTDNCDKFSKFIETCKVKMGVIEVENARLKEQMKMV